VRSDDRVPAEDGTFVPRCSMHTGTRETCNAGVRSAHLCPTVALPSGSKKKSKVA